LLRPESFDLAPLNVSLAPVLGDYYQDLSPALAFVESGHYGASLDDAGVPLARFGDQGVFHNAVITAQYALANLIALTRGDDRRRDRAQAQLEWLVASQQTSGELAGCWLMEYDNEKYPWLRAPWTSALASGTSISALLRGWETFGDDRYRAAATTAYEALHRPGAGLTLNSPDTRELWYEEYPAEPPLHVLNGHAYALLGVVDHARVTGDLEAEERWRLAAATLLSHLAQFDLGYWSAYDLRSHEPASLHYQKNIHVPLLRILATLTGESGFTAAADRWANQFRSRTSRVRWHVALRLQRFRRGAKS
jgi:hypothetical protein